MNVSPVNILNEINSSRHTGGSIREKAVIVKPHGSFQVDALLEGMGFEAWIKYILAAFDGDLHPNMANVKVFDSTIRQRDNR